MHFRKVIIERAKYAGQDPIDVAEKNAMMNEEIANLKIDKEGNMEVEYKNIRINSKEYMEYNS